MTRINFTFGLDRKALDKAARKSAITTLPRAGALIRAIARNSLGRKKGKTSKERASAPGQPPNTRGLLRRSIRFELINNKTGVIIGPDANLISNAGKAHEFGGRFRREVYPKRPFMGPALEKALPKLPRLWAKSVRG